MPANWTLPADGWTVNLEEFPNFCYDHLFAHLISNSKTIASNQKSNATKTYKAGAMKHKEAGFRLFKDDHVKKVRFHPGCGTKCFCCALVQASFKSSTSYSTSVCLHKLNSSVIGARCRCKAGAGGCCKHVAALLYYILDISNLHLKHIPNDRTCTDKPQQWNVAKEFKGGPVLFSDILFVHHTFGKRKAEEEESRMAKRKKYRACPISLQRVTEDEIRTLCTGLESNHNSSTFARLLRGNDCNPIMEDSEVGSCSGAMTVQDLESQGTETQQERSDDADYINIDTDHEIDVIDMEEAVFSHISIIQETVEKIQIDTMQQSQSLAWYKECQWRITAPYFGQILCKMRKSVRLATTISSQCQKQFVSAACFRGKDNEPKAIDS